MPMSSLCRAKMSLNSTNVSSRFSRSLLAISEFVQWNIERNLFRYSSFSVGLSCSCSASSRSYFKSRFCMGECSCSFPGFSGVGNQTFSSLSSGRSSCIEVLMYVTTSSCSVKRLSAAMSTGRIIFVSSGFKICNLTVWCLHLLCREIRCIGNFYTYLLVTGSCYCRRYYEFAQSSNCGRGCIVSVFG